MTKDLEVYFFNQFQEIYKDMPLGQPEFDDRPDVRYTTVLERTIGIELTECIYDQVLMQKSEHQIKFNEKVVSKLKDKMPFKFFIDIDLDSRHPIRQNQLVKTTNEIIDVCMLNFADLNPYESKDILQLDVDWSEAPIHIQQHFHSKGYRKLPKGIVRIQMSRYDSLERSRHPETKGGVVPDFTIENLKRILEKKNRALANYKVCDEQWLLICEGSDFYSYMNNVRIEGEFDSQFDKIFMYRSHPAEVIVLK